MLMGYDKCSQIIQKIQNIHICLLVRLFMMCSIQLNGNRKYNQLEKEVKDEDFKLEFK